MARHAAGVEVSPDQRRLATLLRLFWHPVCTVGELARARPHPLAVELLGRRFAVADVGANVGADAGEDLDAAGEVELMAVPDRCPHRSTRLSVGWVEPGA